MNGDVHFFSFQPEISFSGKFGPKNQTWQFKVKLGTSTNSNIHNLRVVFTLCFRPEILFLGKFGRKNQNYHFKLKFGTDTYYNMHKSMVIIIFSVSNRKYPFWANLVHKIIIVSLSWSLETRLIWIGRIQWRCSLSLFSTRNIFLGQIWSIKSKWSV